MPSAPPPAQTRPARRRGARARRGAVLVEYALLLVAVGIPAIAGISTGGSKMYASYQRARSAFLQNTP